MNLLVATKAVLGDGKCYLSQISQSEYIQPISILGSSTIGQHTRHYIEFYLCLVSQQIRGEVNYDLRMRNIQIECEPDVAIEVIDQLLDELCDLVLEKQLMQHTSLQKEGIRTTVGRELLYNVEHTIHHLAMIRIGLRHICPEMELPTNFGVAPSTLDHRQKIVSN